MTKHEIVNSGTAVTSLLAIVYLILEKCLN